MLKVHELLQLSLCKNFNLVCGDEFLDNTFQGAVILEYESIENDYSAFAYGDFVIASYYFSYFNKDIVDNAISTIIKKHVSGIAIKLCKDQTIPKEIIDIAENNHVPVFTFTDQYVEDLIININESLKTKAQYIVFEEKLNSLLYGNPDSHTVKKTALEINPDFCPYVISASITSKESNDNIAIHSYFRKLMYSQYRNIYATSYSFIKHDYGIILICSFNEDNIPETGSHYTYISSILREVEFVPSKFHIGISDTALPLNRLDESVKKAIDANAVCRYLGNDYNTFSNIGIYKYIISIVNNLILYKDIENQINILKNYDRKYASNLLDTVIIFVKSNGDIKKTSELIFQHANTVRYRIKKACSLLNLSSENSYEELFIIVTCYMLKSSMTEA